MAITVANLQWHQYRLCTKAEETSNLNEARSFEKFKSRLPVEEKMQWGPFGHSLSLASTKPFTLSNISSYDKDPQTVSRKAQRLRAKISKTRSQPVITLGGFPLFVAFVSSSLSLVFLPLPRSKLTSSFCGLWFPLLLASLVLLPVLHQSAT